MITSHTSLLSAAADIINSGIDLDYMLLLLFSSFKNLTGILRGGQAGEVLTTWTLTPRVVHTFRAQRPLLTMVVVVIERYFSSETRKATLNGLLEDVFVLVMLQVLLLSLLVL